MIKLLFKSGTVRALGILSGFLVNVLLARLLTQSEVGLYLIYFSVAMFLSIFVRMGMKQTALRFIAENQSEYGGKEIRQIANSILSIVLFANIFMYSVYGLFHQFLTEYFSATQTYLIYACYWTTGLSLLIPVSEIIRGSGRIIEGAFLDNVLNNVLILLVFSTFLYFGVSLSIGEALAIAICATVILIIYGMLRILLLFPLSALKRNINYKDLLKVSHSVLFINLSTYLLANAGLWFVGAYGGSEDAANYGIALRIYNLLAFPLVVINISIETRIVDLLKKKETHELCNLMRKTASIGFYASAVVFTILLILGQPLITKVFGDEYHSAYMYTMILAGGNLIKVWTGSSISYLVLSGQQKVVRDTTILAAVCLLAIAYFVVDKYGTLSMAICTAATVSIQQLWLWRKLMQSKIKTHPFLNVLDVIHPKLR